MSFLDPDNPKHLMRRMRRLFNRANLDQNELNILRGLLSAYERTVAGRSALSGSTWLASIR